MQDPTGTIDDGERWPDDKPPEPENYQYYSEGFTLYYTPKPEQLQIERREPEGILHEVESAWRETGVICPHCSGDWMTYSDGVNAPQCSNPDCLAVIDDTEPTPRWCWRCERETKQVRTESGGEVWWMCTRCYECERQEWQELRSASQSLTAAIRQRFNPYLKKFADVFRWLCGESERE